MSEFKSYHAILKAFENVFFEQEKHAYFIEGKETKYSSTKLLKNWTPVFDSVKMANIVAQKQGFLPEDILDKWDFEREFSCFKGTMLHEYIEKFLDRKPTPTDQDKIKTFLIKNNRKNELSRGLEEFSNHVEAFKQFYNWWKNDHFLVKTELVIGDSRGGGIGGTIDNLSYNHKEDKYVLFDYKSNKEVGTKNKYKEKLLKPFQHLDNCELVKYSLQLLIYRKILKDNSGVDVDVKNCNIVWLSREGEFKMYSVLPLENEVETIFNLI
jgi:ATP-dependent exoDNAse (exonuclease V) beta subunit